MKKKQPLGMSATIVRHEQQDSTFDSVVVEVAAADYAQRAALCANPMGSNPPTGCTAFSNARAASGPSSPKAVIPRHRVSPSASPMTGSCGGSSTPRLLGFIADVSDYWIVRSSRTMTAGGVDAPRSTKKTRHPPRTRGIQYAAASRLYHQRLGLLDRPVKPDDDSWDLIFAGCKTHHRRLAHREARS